MKQITNLGYACINSQLSSGPKDRRVTTNRSMIKRTFKQKGLPYASQLALQNCKDLNTILKWNVQREIYFYRMSSDIFPWASEYDLCELPDYEEICFHLKRAGIYATQNNVRLTFHPGPFNVLTSPRDHVVKNCIKDLSIHGEILDIMGMSRTPYNKINIHIGGAYGDKTSAMERFCNNFNMLPDSVKSRLTVENDDKASMYSVKDLFYGVYKVIGIPIVFDYHHHKFCDGGLSEQKALELALSTWGDITPAVHYSQSRAEEHNDPSIRKQAHSDSYWLAPDMYDHTFDVMLECKHKEVGLQKMRLLLS
tara:strand:+ start:717 stop:1643 length:927 start_codon:yes stop_codon:yes gene_type:complete